MEKREDRKNLIFLHVCLVGEMEKWRDEKLLYLFEKKNEKIKIYLVQIYFHTPII